MIPKEKLEFLSGESYYRNYPIAFARGRTPVFMILDESEYNDCQMKMFLTRMGENARFIITGDTSQIDLPKHQKSGLKEAITTLKGIKGIGCVELDGRDVIRHPLVKKIITAYDRKD